MGVFTDTLPVWVAGEDILAADLDTMTDALDALTSSWTPYPVTWSSGGTQPSIGNGTLEGRYFRTGKFTGVHIRLIMGGTTTFGTGQYFLDLPVNSRVSNVPLSCYLLDNGTANKAGIACVTSGLNQLFMIQNTTDVAATAPHTWANGDRIDICGIYEVA